MYTYVYMYLKEYISDGHNNTVNREIFTVKNFVLAKEYKNLNARNIFNTGK